MYLNILNRYDLYSLLVTQKRGGVVCLLANTKAKLKRQRLVRKKRDVNQKLYNLGE